MKISIVIPNYNGAILLKKNIPRLLRVLEQYIAKTKNTIELFIVDDYSQDDSIAVIEEIQKQHNTSSVRFRLITKTKNSGFSPTVNLGAKHATGEVLVLLNSDAYPEDDFITPFLHHFKSNDLFAVGFMDKSIEEGRIVLRGRGIGRWKRGFLIHKKGGVDKETTLWVNGGSGAFRKKTWDLLGGMDELYSPFYWEDIDLSYRALKSGYTVRFEKKSTVVHEHEKGAIVKTYTKDQVQQIAYRNQIMFTWLNATDTTILISHFIWFPIQTVQAILRWDINFLKGFFSAFLLFPNILQSRDVRKSLFRLSDQAVITSVET